MIKRYHVCEVLKEFTKDLYTYPKNDWLDTVFAYLDYVLICNQHITNTFTHILANNMTDFYEHYPGGLFPKFLENYPQGVIKDNVDRINQEIEDIQPCETVPIPQLYTLSKFDLLDLRVPYKHIIQILKHVGDPIIERAEYGYYIGSLLKISVDGFIKEYGPDAFDEPNWNVLDDRVKTFRSGVFCTLENKRTFHA